MSKEKLVSLLKYEDGLKNKLASPTPEKHKDHPESYKQFLERELQMVAKSIETMREGLKK